MMNNAANSCPAVLFFTARRNAPAVIFFDEFDSIASQRSVYADGGARANNAVVAQLLTEMDGFRRDQAVLVIGTSNRIDIIDEALLRPSRLKPVEIGLPDLEARRQVARIHAKSFAIDSYFKNFLVNQEAPDESDESNDLQTLMHKLEQEGVNQARLWLDEIAEEPKRQTEEKTRALLILAAALHFDRQLDQAHTAYDTAREKLAQATKKSPPLTNGKNWEALAIYGVMVKRPDLVRLGYEKALIAYGQTFNLQRLRCAKEYLANVADDFYLAKELKERLADWRPQSTIKRERERLWEALAKFTGKEDFKI